MIYKCYVEALKIPRAFQEVLCVTEGNGYKYGNIYPLVGTNNGVHIIREDENGNPYDGLFVTGGIGEGEFNNPDDSGVPSFVSVVDEIPNLIGDSNE